MCNAIGVLELAIASEAIEHECKTLVALHIAGTFEIFIEHCADQVLGRWDKARRACLVGKLSADQALVVGKVNIDLYI